MQEGSDDEPDLGYDDQEGDDEGDEDENPVLVAELEVGEDVDLDTSAQNPDETQPDPDLDSDQDLDPELPDADTVRSRSTDDTQTGPSRHHDTQDQDEAGPSRAADEDDRSSDSDIIPPTPPLARSPDLFDDQSDADLDQHSEQDTDTDPVDDPEHLMFDDSTEWVHNIENYPVNPPFTGQSGFLIDIPDTATTLWFYQLFITNTLIKRMKTETNRYAASTCRQALRRNPNLGRRSFFRMWKTVTELDICMILYVSKVNKEESTLAR